MKFYKFNEKILHEGILNNEYNDDKYISKARCRHKYINQIKEGSLTPISNEEYDSDEDYTLMSYGE